MNSEMKTWTNATIGAMVVCVLLLLFQFFGPKPASQTRKWQEEKLDLEKKINGAKENLPDAETELAAKVWTESPDQLGAILMGAVQANARKNGLNMLAFRPQKTEEDSGVVRHGYSVSLEGRFPQVIEFLRAVETPESKLAVGTLQIAAADGATDAVTATVGIVAYRRAEEILQTK